MTCALGGLLSQDPRGRARGAARANMLFYSVFKRLIGKTGSGLRFHAAARANRVLHSSPVCKTEFLLKTDHQIPIFSPYKMLNQSGGLCVGVTVAHGCALVCEGTCSDALPD